MQKTDLGIEKAIPKKIEAPEVAYNFTDAVDKKTGKSVVIMAKSRAEAHEKFNKKSFSKKS